MRSLPSPSRVRACFLDVDGVILDPQRTPLEWQRLEGEILAPALGGSVADWGDAAAVVVPRLFGGGPVWDDPDPIVSERLIGIRVIREMCAELGVTPPSDDAADALERAIEIHVFTHMRAAFEGAADAIHSLARLTALHTATGNCSWRLVPLLGQLGVLEYFGVLTGPDLVGVHKHTAEFYPRTFEAAGVTAPEVLVVDDDPGALARAASLGAQTVLIGAASAVEGIDHTLTSITRLPSLLASLAEA